MKTVLVTGANGFIGRNLIHHLNYLNETEVLSYDINDNLDTLESWIIKADFIFHLAGINRPQNVAEYETGNRGFTVEILKLLKKYHRYVPLLMTSSTQAALENPYGISKRRAEECVFSWARETDNEAFIYRLPNVFGKWCKPNYNSVVATFCHNIARDLPIQINNPAAELRLVYIDDVIAELIGAMNRQPTQEEDGFCYVSRVFRTTLQELVDKIFFFRESRNNLVLPDFHDDFTRFLYATYLSYLPENEFSYAVKMKHDQRGWLTELLKSKQFGQVFISRTKPGITRGNHWHHTKVEKFIVIEGKAVVRFRRIDGGKVIEVPVSGDELKTIDIPIGYTHSITNVGDTDLLTLFWADEIFSQDQPDTYYQEVLG